MRITLALRRWLFRTVLLWVALTVSPVLLLRWVDPPTSMVMLTDRTAALLRGDSQYHFQFRWLPLSDINAQLPLAVIAAEDQKFADHWGFDFSQISKAIQDGQRGRLRGASTITQQVAKNIFLWRTSSWPRKALEAYFAVLIEVCWPKQRILEVYVNVAEWGNGIFGAGAASHAHFGKPAARLTAQEGALLAATLPNPLRLNASAPNAYVRGRQQWILRQMRALGGTQYLDRLQP